jgi:uncharacterized membrane protein
VTRHWLAASAAVRLAVAGVVGVIVGVAGTLAVVAAYAPLIGWDAAAATFVAGTWLSVRALDHVATREAATREDPSTGVSDLVLLIAALGSLAGVAAVLLGAGQSGGSGGGGGGGGARELAPVLAGTASVALSWATVHTVFCLRYARLFYTAPIGGLDFKDPDPPCYLDFAYLAFTIGMTFQVSDTDVTDRRIRATVLRHSLISFLFGTVVIAVTVNLVAGLSR